MNTALPKIACIGGLGFVTSIIADRLIRHGYETTIIDDCSFGSVMNAPENSIVIHSDYALVPDEIYQRFDIIVFGACSNIIYAADHPVLTFENNALKAIDLFGRFTGKIINLSTASVYGQAQNFPTTEDDQMRVSNAYDMSKLIAERYLALRGNYTTLRLSNVYGTNQRKNNPYCGVMAKFIDQAMAGQSIQVIGDGSQTRDFNFVDNVVDAVMKAVDMPALNTEINIATGVETSILDLARCVIDITASKSEIEYVAKRSIDRIDRRCLDISRAGELLGWQPQISLPEGVKRTVEWVKKEYRAQRVR